MQIKFPALSGNFQRSNSSKAARDYVDFSVSTLIPSGGWLDHASLGACIFATTCLHNLNRKATSNMPQTNYLKAKNAQLYSANEFRCSAARYGAKERGFRHSTFRFLTICLVERPMVRQGQSQLTYSSISSMHNGIGIGVPPEGSVYDLA